ncbi:amyloid-beta A4 precursor protein-binding family A member 3 [Pelodytes ibericus]
MENGMEFQVPVSGPSSCPPRTAPELPHDGLETPGTLFSEPSEACDGICQDQGILESACADALGRVPPRVDSCPDMDTRPPLTPELMGMDLDAQLEETVPNCTFHMQELLSELPTLNYETEHLQLCSSSVNHGNASLQEEAEHQECQSACQPCPLHIVTGKGFAQALRRLSESSCTPSNSHGLFLTDAGSEELLSLFQYEDRVLAEDEMATPLARLELVPMIEPSSLHSMQDQAPEWKDVEIPSFSSELNREDSCCSLAEVTETTLHLPSHHPTPAKVPGPCDPEDLLDGVIFGAKYLGSTQLQCGKNPVTSTRMKQAQEAVDRVKAPDGESQPMTEVDVMVSTQRVKVLTADTQETLMDHPLQTISYTADIGNIVVLMARRKSSRSQDGSSAQNRQKRILCHVFQSTDAQLIAQAIGQAFGLAYQNFLHSEGVEPVGSGTAQAVEQLYNADLAYFSKRENCREVYIQKQRGEVLGVAVVESGWGSLLPTVVIANLMHGGPAERSGELSIGDHVTCINGTSLVGLPLSTSQGLIRELKGQSEVVLNIVRCPPVITAIIQRPDTSHQLGFCVEDGVICSLVRGGIAERGGIRVGHRIIEINEQNVVATSHEKIIQTLLDATGEVHIKTMPASTYRLLTGQETPHYL